MYLPVIRQFQKTLRQIDTWLTLAEEHAKAKSFDPNVFLTLRLAPDQFPFVRQVQSTCDTAKLAASRLGGKEAPSHPDTEATIGELRTRVAAVVEYLGTFSEKDFAEAANRPIKTPRWPGPMKGSDYLLEHALPNFFFHSTTSYAILRHNGVSIGKKNFLGDLTFQPA